MLNILPENYKELLKSERDLWSDAQLIIDQLIDEFEFTKSTKPQLKRFTYLTSKNKLNHHHTWKVSKDENSFNLCLVDYEINYNTAGPTGGFSNKEVSIYLFGHLNLKTNFGISLIRPETIEDKIFEFFKPIEIDFKNYPKFSFKYFVTSEESEKLKNALTPTLIEFIEKIKGLQLEFRNYSCIFRLPKSIEIIESKQLCEIGIALDKIINR